MKKVQSTVQPKRVTPLSRDLHTIDTFGPTLRRLTAASASAATSTSDSALSTPSTTETSGASGSARQTSAAESQYRQRTGIGRVEFTRNDDLSKLWTQKDAMEDEESDAGLISIDVLNPLKKQFKYMDDKLEERSTKLEDHLRQMSHLILTHHKLDPPLPIQTMSQEDGIFVGRIVCDHSGDGKLNSQSILLEDEEGSIVRLILGETEMYSLFPGQVVALKGANRTGKGISVSEFYLGAPPDSAVRSESRSNAPCAQRPIQIFVASGPFTTDQDFDFLPLLDLLKVATKEAPDILILIGPFIEDRHSLVKTGSCEEDYQTILATKIAKQVQQHFLSKVEKSRVIFMPSLHDITHDYVYPQPPFDPYLDLELDEPDNVLCISNPAMIKINNDISIALTSNDIMFQLSAEEISNKFHLSTSGKPSRMANLSEHLILQQSFYPFHMPRNDVPLDISHMDFLALQALPTILVVPSYQQHLPKVWETPNTDVICINPGKLYNPQKSSGGTFSKITVYPESVLTGLADAPQTAQARATRRICVQLVNI